MVVTGAVVVVVVAAADRDQVREPTTYLTAALVLPGPLEFDARAVIVTRELLGRFRRMHEVAVFLAVQVRPPADTVVDTTRAPPLLTGARNATLRSQTLADFLIEETDMMTGAPGVVTRAAETNAGRAAATMATMATADADLSLVRLVRTVM